MSYRSSSCILVINPLRNIGLANIFTCGRTSNCLLFSLRCRRTPDLKLQTLDFMLLSWSDAIFTGLMASVSSSESPEFPFYKSDNLTGETCLCSPASIRKRRRNQECLVVYPSLPRHHSYEQSRFVPPFKTQQSAEYYRVTSVHARRIISQVLPEKKQEDKKWPKNWTLYIYKTLHIK